jgi:DNA topoisomerase-1
VIKTGRFGEFLSCTGYPTCKNARPVPLGVACPKCGGDIIEIRPRKRGGRTFYGCSNYNAEQKCDFKLWMRPIPEPCPQCGAAFLTKAGGKKPMLICATKDCGYKRELPEDGEEDPTADGAPPGAASADGTSAPVVAAPKPPPVIKAAPVIKPAIKVEAPKPAAAKAEAKPKAVVKKRAAAKAPSKADPPKTAS